MPKTVVIYDQLDADVKFAVLDGDYSHLNGVYINSCVPDTDAENYAELEAALEKKNEELSNLFYYPDTGKDKLELLEEFPTQAVRDGAIVIVAGFLP